MTGHFMGRAAGCTGSLRAVLPPPHPLFLSPALEHLAVTDLHQAISGSDSAGSSPDLYLLAEGILLLQSILAMDAGNSLDFESRTNSYFV